MADAATVADFAVAAGTLVLASVTAVLAWQARDQARSTGKLAETSEAQLRVLRRQVVAQTTPVLRIQEGGDGTVDIVESEAIGGKIRAYYENHGSVPASIGAATLDGDPGRIQVGRVEPKGGQSRSSVGIIEFDVSVLDPVGAQHTIQVNYSSADGVSQHLVKTVVESLGSKLWKRVDESEQ